MTSDKQKTLTLVWGVKQYEVKAITNSTLYKPGQWLDVPQVELLCNAPNWNVMISDDTTIQQLFQQAFGIVIKDIPIPKL